MSFVLIIEDSAVISQPIAAVLARCGYETQVADNGAEALKRIRGDRVPDLILLDIHMPVMDGLTFLATLRADERTRRVPVIMLTGVAEKQRVMRAVQLGINGYVLKSRFSLKELLEMVRKAIGQPSEEAPSGENLSVPEANGGTEAKPDRSEAKAPTTPESTSAASPVSLQATNAEEAAAEGSDLRSLKPIVSRTEITEKLENCGELKSLSPAVAQVLKLTRSSHCSIEQVARAISQDHGMALKVLKLANSAVYTRGEPVDSVQLAVMRIGLGQIRQTLLNISVIEHFNSGQSEAMSDSNIDFGQFWEHAIATGLIAAELTRFRDPKETDTAFTLGLLHDVGRMFLVDQFREIYPRVLETAARLRLPVEQVESRMLLLNHADVMDRLLHSWKFPKQLINSIVFHHLSAGNIRRNAPRQIEEVATLALANRMAHALMLGSSGNETIYPTEELCQLLKLEPNVLDAIAGYATDHMEDGLPFNGVREECDRMKFALLSSGGGHAPNWAQLREVHREALGAPLRALFVSETPQYDACRIFCREMSDHGVAGLEEGDDAAPNLGVIHFTNVRERVPLTSKYRAAEQAAGASNLPLIILSPAGKIMPETSLLASRSHESLATPFTIASFVETVNRLLGGAASATGRAKAA